MNICNTRRSQNVENSVVCSISSLQNVWVFLNYYSFITRLDEYKYFVILFLKKF